MDSLAEIIETAMDMVSALRAETEAPSVHDTEVSLAHYDAIFQLERQMQAVQVAEENQRASVDRACVLANNLREVFREDKG